MIPTGAGSSSAVPARANLRIVRGRSLVSDYFAFVRMDLRLPPLPVRPRTAVALAAGGVNCAVGAGFARAADRLGWLPDELVLSSGGVPTGIGWMKYRGDPERVARIWRLLEGRRLLDPQVRRMLVREFGPNERLEDLSASVSIPISVIVTCIDHPGGRRVVREGRIRDIVLAATAFPPVHRPVLLDGARCMDGGIVDYWGIRTAQEQGCSQVLSIGHSSPPPARHRADGDRMPHRRRRMASGSAGLGAFLQAGFREQLDHDVKAALACNLRLLLLQPELPGTGGLFSPMRHIDYLIRIGEALGEGAITRHIDERGVFKSPFQTLTHESLAVAAPEPPGPELSAGVR